mgnify:CR=1 FL=1
MLKKLVALLMALSMMLSMTAVAETAQEPVTISFYSTQAGVDDATVALLGKFMEQHPGITVNYYPCGDDQLAAWLALYSAGTAPTVSMLYSKANVVNSLMEKIAAKCAITPKSNRTQKADDLMERLNLIKNWR